MSQQSLTSQIKKNAIALISLVIALTALCYNTWREEVTEKNRNIRQASFEVLKSLGQLQLTINLAKYDPKNSLGNPLISWGYISVIGDMSRIIPPPVPETVDRLLAVWHSDWENISSDEESLDRVTKEIDESRKAVLKKISQLN